MIRPAIEASGDAAADAKEVRAFMLALGVALTMTGDAVSAVQERLRAIAASYGYDRAQITVLPTSLIIALRESEPAAMRTIDSSRQLRLDQSSEVIRVARSAEAGEVDPVKALTAVLSALDTKPRFGTLSFIASHALLTLGLGLVIGPASVDLWWYLALGALVGGMKAWSRHLASGGALLALVAATLVSAIVFLTQQGSAPASLRLIIPPLVTFIPGALLTMGMVDLAMGETVTGASRVVAGTLQLALLAIAIVVGTELVGSPPSGPIAGSAAQDWGSWQAWLGVAIFGAAISIHHCAPRGALPWLLIVLFTAWIGQLLGKQIIDATLSGFVGAAVMVPVAHAVAHARTAPPAHVMFLPAFWLLVPGTIGLIGVTELVGKNPALATQNLLSTAVSIPSVALGILVGALTVRGISVARHQRLFS